MKLGMLGTCGEEFHFVLYLGCCFQLAEQCISCWTSFQLNIELLSTSKYKFLDKHPETVMAVLKCFFYLVFKDFSNIYTSHIVTSASMNWQAQEMCLFSVPALGYRRTPFRVFVSCFCHFEMQPKERLTNSLHSSQHLHFSNSIWPHCLSQQPPKYTAHCCSPTRDYEASFGSYCCSSKYSLRRWHCYF